jgi:hypothetical protein
MFRVSPALCWDINIQIYLVFCVFFLANLLDSTLTFSFPFFFYLPIDLHISWFLFIFIPTWFSWTFLMAYSRAKVKSTLFFTYYECNLNIFWLVLTSCMDMQNPVRILYSTSLITESWAFLKCVCNHIVYINVKKLDFLIILHSCNT